MSRIKLDLSQFKHVKSDDKTTTLQHTQGHILQVAHNALSKEAKGQLDALSKMSKEHQTNTQAQEAQDQSPKPMAEGGQVGMEATKKENYKKDKKPKESPETIVVPNAQDGVGAANEVRKHKDLPHGATILIEKVKKYAEGGMIDDLVKAVQDYHNASDPDKPKAEVNRDPNQQKAAQASSEVRGYAKGGKIPGYLSNNPDALPQEAQPQTPDFESEEQSALALPKTPDQAQNYLDKDAMINRSIETEKSKIKSPDMEGVYTGQDPTLIERQAIKNLADDQDANKTSTEVKAKEQKYQLDRLNEERARLGLPPKTAEMPEAGTPSQMAQPNQTPDQGIAPQTPTVAQGLVSQGMPGATTDPEGMLHQGYQDVRQGIQDEATAVGKLGSDQAKLIDKSNEAKQQAMEAFESEKNKNFAERDALVQDIKDGQVDPNKFWTGDKDGNGSHSKIAAGIGMILAGFNPTDRPNAAIDFLNKQMDMNLQAQMRNLGSKETLLSHNMQQFRNIKDASEFTRIQMNDVLQHQLESAAATAKSPLAQAAAKQAAGKLAMDSSNLFMNFSMRRAMMGLRGNTANPSDTSAAEQMLNYARFTNPEYAKQLEQLIVPGVGVATVAVPDHARQEMTSKQSLLNAGQDLLNYSKTHTNIVPGTAEYKYGTTKAMAFQQAVRDGLLGTVFRESEKPLLEQFVKENPAGAFKAISTQPQLRAILDSTNMSLNTLKGMYHLPQTTTAAEPVIRRTTDGRSAKFDPNTKKFIGYVK